MHSHLLHLENRACVNLRFNDDSIVNLESNAKYLY